MEVSLSIFYYKYITNTLSKNPAFTFNRDDKVINFPFAEPSLIPETQYDEDEDEITSDLWQEACWIVIR